MILIVSNFCMYILCAYGLKDTLEIIKNKFPQIQTQTIYYMIHMIDIYRIDSRIINQDKIGQQNQITTIESFDVFNEDETIIF